MRNRLLTLLGMAFIGVASFAQTWTEPVEPTDPSVPVSGQLYRVKNVAADMYVGHGATWFGWNTTACLVENSPITWTMTYDEAKAGWTFAGYDDNWPGQFLFISGNGIDGFAMHVDNPTDPHRYFELIPQGDETYRVRCVASDDTYGENIENWADRFWGCNPDGDMPNAMYAAVNPDDGFQCDWIFINMSTYFLQKDLFDLAVEIEEGGYDIDYAKYTDAYNSGDYDQMKAAYDELKPLVEHDRVYAILAFGDDGVNPPSNDNPCTRATELIKNNDFSAGNIDGWTCTFKSGENATNVGYQQNSDYSYNGVTISKFIEAWANSAFNPNYTWRAIGDGKLSQVMEALPQGKYMFTCDAISNQQDGHNPATGVELFATGGELEKVAGIATGNGQPEHFEVTFISTGGNVEIGLRTNNASANWIAADNFTLTYFGEVSGDPAKILLDSYIAELEKTYDLLTIKAEQAVITNYETIMDAAKNATEDYEAHQANLEAAAKTLQESIDEYVTLKNEIASINKQIRMAQKDWQNLAYDLSDLVTVFQQKYDEGTATSEEIAVLGDRAYNMCAEFISAALIADPEGSIDKEITLLIKNPGFDTAFSEWTVKDGAPTWGGENVQLPAEHVAYPNTVDGLVDGGCAEQWHRTFDIQQTIANMPAGVFQLSCQAFQRDDESDGIDAVLYAVVGTSEQTVNVMDINADAQDESLYNSEYGGGHGEAGTHNGDAVNGEGKYTPNGMSGANVYFRAGLYKNYFNFVVGMVSDITIGIRTKSSKDWVLFDDFKLVYKGEDIEKYKEMIRERKETLAQMLDENEVAVTDSIEQLVQDVQAQADDALASSVGKTCTDAIQALLDAADAVTANLAFMQAFKEEFEELYYFRYEQEGLEGDIPEIMTDIEDKLDPEGNYKFANNAAVDQARIDMVKAYNQFVQECLAGNASEGDPADISYVIYNPNNLSYDPDVTEPIGEKGWNVPVGTVGHGYPSDNGINEFFQSNEFEFSQTILGLNPGYYRLKVYGYYRDGSGARIDSCLNKVEGFKENSRAMLFAGDAQTRMLNISECYEQYTELIEDGSYEGVTTGNSVKIELVGEEENQTIYIPNGVAACKVIFAFDEEEDGVAPLYENVLQFKVEEGQGDVTIGLRKNHEETEGYGDWTVWNNWKLEYVGTDVPDVDPTTAILGVEATAPVKVAIYNMAGQRVNKAVKGVYIINGKKYIVK